MIRKFNYTGRKKLKRQRIGISVVDERPYKSFAATLNLKGLGLSDDARVYIEPYYKSSFMRFSFGTVSNPQIPDNTILTDIPSTSIIHFRVKVVDETTKLGRIIQLADKIKPKNMEESGNRISILHLNYIDLEQQIFRIKFPPDYEFPTLELNKKIENIKELIKSDQIFRSLVFPIAVRQVAKQIAMTCEEFEEEDDSWQSKWMKFIKEVLHVAVDVSFEESNEDGVNHWVEEIVAAFCRKNRVRTKFEQTINNLTK